MTGGSRGIAVATARLAAGLGYAVAINYRTTKESAAAVVAEIESTGGRAIAVQADVFPKSARSSGCSRRSIGGSGA